MRQTQPNVHFHFTPTYSSWLNQVEIWFSKVERDVIARGILTSVKDLARKLAAISTPTQRTLSHPVEIFRSDPPHPQ